MVKVKPVSPLYMSDKKDSGKKDSSKTLWNDYVKAKAACDELHRRLECEMGSGFEEIVKTELDVAMRRMATLWIMYKNASD